MEIVLYIFFGFGVLVFGIIGFAAWRTIKTPLGEGKGTRGSNSDTLNNLDKHRNID